MTTADAQAFWAASGGAGWLATYADSGGSEWRDWALDGVRQLGHVTSVLEIGCHCGPLLHRLAALPTVARVSGIDVNAEAVAVAQAAGLDVALGAVPRSLAKVPSRSFDVVVSSYCLAYVAPEDLPEALAHCLRIAERGLVLVEPSAGPGLEPATFEAGAYVEWRHEYLDAVMAARDLLATKPAIEATRTRRGVGVLNSATVVRMQWPTEARA